MFGKINGMMEEMEDLIPNFPFLSSFYSQVSYFKTTSINKDIWNGKEIELDNTKMDWLEGEF